MPPPTIESRSSATRDENARAFPSGVPRRKKAIRPSRLSGAQVAVLLAAAAAVVVSFLMPPWSVGGSEDRIEYHFLFGEAARAGQRPHDDIETLRADDWPARRRNEKKFVVDMRINHAVLWLQVLVILTTAVIAMAVVSADNRVRTRHPWAYSRSESVVHLLTFFAVVAGFTFPPWQDADSLCPVGYYSVFTNTSWAPVQQPNGAVGQYASLLRIDAVEGARRQLTICHYLLWPQLALFVGLGRAGARRVGAWSYKRRRDNTQKLAI